jgi:RHS repeat-associated protein
LGAAVVLAASISPVLPSMAEAVGNPSVPLPDTKSVPVSAQGMGPTGRDEASDRALTGNQPDRPGTGVAGSSAATPLSPSATWDVAAHTGDFSWSYPLRVPPAPGGLVPNLALSYRSSEVDGRTSVTNNQPSWIGDGWSLSPGFIERTYGACVDDSEGFQPPQVGDLCWKSDNATAAYGGHGGKLICCDADKRWRAESDDGSRIERIVDSNHRNGDNDGEHWKITTVDGTEYWFGSQVDSNSTWTVPVFGDDANEPCNRPGSFDGSSCAQSWRWMMDKVVDRNGNIIRYYYDAETNSYGLNVKDTAVPYTRGGFLSRIDYGLRQGVADPIGRVLFTPADRCVQNSSCTLEEKDWNNWPDTDLANRCVSATCKDHYSPTFWTTKRLASITTQVRAGATFTNVDRWDLDQAFPDPGDGEKAALWLKGIKHTGLAGGEQSLAQVTFTGTPYANRVDTAEDGLAPLNRFRISGVVSESGGWTSVTYSSECKPTGPLPNKDRLQENTLRCFPLRWNKKNHEPRLDYFHKYVVDRVTQSDRMSANKQQVTSYEYLGGAAWHFDTSEFMKEDKKTWNEFRGYGKVRVHSGTDDDPSGARTMTEQRFHRGMNGDKNSSGTRKVTDSNNVEYVDDDWLAGLSFETATFDRDAPSDQEPLRVSKTISKVTKLDTTATRGAYTARLVRESEQHGYTAMPDNKWRTTRTVTKFDDRALPFKVNDLGDVATADDDRCTTTTYARDTGKWLLNLPGNVETVSVTCDQGPVFPKDALGVAQTTFDGNGNATKVEMAKERPATKPVYIAAATTEYDNYGRPTAITNAAGHTTRTEYAPKVGGPLTKTVVTTPPTAALEKGMVTTTELHPAWGAPTKVTDSNDRVTETAYDALGRSVQVWLPNRPRADYATKPSVAHEYAINRDAPTVVKTTKLGPKGTPITSHTIYDGFLRARQIQAPAMGGGRLLTDTRYDSQGRAWKSTQPYFNTANIDTTLLVASDTDVPGHTRTHYDGAGRVDASIYFAGTNEKWRTTTSYSGDRVTVTPPAGGTATTKVSDARGRATQMLQYTTAGPSNAFEATSYTHNKAGQLETVTTPGGATWRYRYDLLGRQTTVEDPDTGTATSTYNDLDLVETRTTPAGTVAYAYDALGRTTGTYRDRLGGNPLTELTYDTAVNGKGQLATSTRVVRQDNADYRYTSAVQEYDPFYQPTASSLSIPSIEGLLAGTYEAHVGYNPDGSLSGETYSAAGELPEEEVNYDYHELGPVNTSTGGYEGQTIRQVTKTEYTRYGEAARLTLGTGTKRAWLSNYYDTSTRRFTRSIVDAEAPAPMQSDRHYTYTPAGTVTSIADTFAGDVQCFRYDQLQRMTDAWTPDRSTWSETEGCKQNPDTDALKGPAQYRHSYVYDKAGNRTKEIQHASGGNSTTRTFNYTVPNKPHRLSSIDTSGPGVRTVEDYTYGPSGEMRARTQPTGNQEFTWDIEGRLATVKENGKTSSFVYAAAGDRLIRHDPDGTTLYLGKQELRVNKAGGNPTVVRYYSHGGSTVAMRQGRGDLTWLAGDHQATTQFAINSDTLAVTQRRQLPFGGPRGEGMVALAGDRGFVGGTKDESTGLTHLGAREYDPDLGRFISVDPVMNPAAPQLLNAYTYSNNNPISFSDPTGLYCDSCDFYSRQPGGGGTSVWTPPPPNRPVISSTDRKVWRQEQGSKASLKRTIPKPKPNPIIECGGVHPMDMGAPIFQSDACIEGMMTNSEAYSEGTHKSFELWNNVPVVGIPFGLADAALYAIEGEYGNAVVTGVGSAIPGPQGGKKKGGPNKACSFTGDTEVVLADGSTKPISKLKIGDEVLAADPETGKQGPRKVTALWAHKDTVQSLSIEGGGTVTTTEDHRFWNATDKQWQRADQLDAGDALRTATGEQTRVGGLRTASKRVDLAYNITVDDLHTYHVLIGKTPVLVHNDCNVNVNHADDGWQTNVTSVDGRLTATVDRQPTGDLLVSNVTVLYNTATDMMKDDLAHVVAVGLRHQNVHSGARRITLLSDGYLDAGVMALQKLGIQPKNITDNEWTRGPKDRYELYIDF